MNFGGMKIRNKDELERDKHLTELTTLQMKLKDKEKKILHRAFIRNASLQDMKAAKMAHAQLSREVARLIRKIRDKWPEVV